MKISWGVGIVIAFVGFITFIMSFVFLMFTDDKYAHDLVVEEYYKQEIGFQEELDAQNHANALAENVEISTTSEGVLIHFPVEENSRKIDGLVSFYRPSEKVLDFTKPIEILDRKMFIPKSELVGGRWDISVRWNYSGNTYLTKKKITF